MMILSYDIYNIIPELFLTLSAMILLMFGAYSKNMDSKMVFKGAIGLLALTGILLLYSFNGYIGTAFSDMIKTNPFSQFLKVLILGSALGVMAISYSYAHQIKTAIFEYPVLLMLSVVGMFIMVSSNSLLSLYMGLELQSLSLYILASIRRNNALSSEAGLKYFVLGALSSGLLLFGISFIYGATGAISYDGIADFISMSLTISPGIIVGMVFMLAAIAFKISAVPFHMWAPDVYQGAPTSVTAFFATAPKIAAFGLLIQLLYGPFAQLSADWTQILYFVSAASMALGAFAGLVQSNIKRLLAYSSIGHVGYALIGLTTGLSGGLNATLTYLAIYLVMSLGMFACILKINKDEQNIESIEDYAGLSKSNPLIAYAMAIFLFSMAGIPPFAGFFGKLVIFKAAIDASLIYLAVFGVITSVVGAYYYLKIIKVMFFDEADLVLDQHKSKGSLAVISLCLLFVVFYIVSPEYLANIIQSVSSWLFVNG
ncbi:MAG: NADH-quinone oxidoreductase subunit NuoN [Micavibrio sp.]|nr:NADH-quinone oxidoreductase subunit NuoN [Micavibrio sp.]